jgi:AbrB family looped-hinge helix DNA binding protein
MTTITRRLTSKGQITIPKQVRDLLNSDLIVFEITNDGIVLKPVENTLEDLYGSVKTPNHLKGKTESEIEEIMQNEIAEKFKNKEK